MYFTVPKTATVTSNDTVYICVQHLPSPYHNIFQDGQVKARKVMMLVHVNVQH